MIQKSLVIFENNQFKRLYGKLSSDTQKYDVKNGLKPASDGIYRKILRDKENPSKETLIKTSLAELIFDQNGPKNTFLNTCKTNQNKTLFNLF
jgi:hypothetical protein